MSTHRRIYLDYNATSPILPIVRDAVAGIMDQFGNPSSIHAEGRQMRSRISQARAQVAALVGRPREHVVFTSGGTEANALGVMGLARLAERRGKARRLATTAIEHPSLRGAVASLAAEGWTVTTLDDPEASVAAFAAVNHELGTIEPQAFDPALQARGVLVHVDAVQAAGKLDLSKLVANTIAISAHKIGGPQGVGALIVDDVTDAALPLAIHDGAGHQERGRRPGTENTLGIVGFGAAAGAIASPASPGGAAATNGAGMWPAVTARGEALERGLLAIDNVRIHGADRRRVGGTINAGFAGARGESIVIALDLAGIAASTGAACTSGSLEPSPVLLALGLSPDQALEAVRFSLGRGTTDADIAQVLAVLPAIVKRVRQHT